ncbi:MAG TPA: TOBE domain-containing protein, partial [Desulfobacteraceae bacterium]|nr:TOBE domain-containing protein [Desulfobacteraceae bacterium]
FLFDEPLSNLDAKLRVQMRAEIVRLHHRLQSTVIYVTHDQVEAMTMGSKIVIQDSGKIMQAGKPIDVYDSPDNKFVAGFIGSPAMNFLEVRLVDEEDGLWAEGDGFRFPVPSTKAAKYAPHAGGKFFLGIRPEHLEDVDFVKEYDPKYIMKAKVELIEPLGSSVILQILLGQKMLVAQVDSHTGARVGEEIQLVADLENMHLFSTEYPHKSLDRA